MSLEASIKNFGLTKQWSAALRLLREGIQLGVQLAPGHYVATVSACRKAGQWQHALSVFSEMWEAKLEPNVISYNVGISACEKGGQWQRALALLSEMREAKLEPDVISYNSGISACEKGEQWHRALAQLNQMCEAKLEPNVISFTAGIIACAKGEQWQPALAQLNQMWEVKLELNVISYNAGIIACGKGRQWQPALALLSEMREAKLEPNVISPTIAGSARALQRWDQRVREGRAVAAGACAAKRDAGGEAGANVISCSAGISACEKGDQWQRALALLSEMWEVKLEPDSLLQRWGQRVREGPAVAAGAGTAERGAGGEAGAHRLSATTLGSARARRAGSGSERLRC
ncbi:unnamed protein product [Prorocentrum cordatum]|uniref:Pentatricopeptide repeat-containing protein, chloroplastic n=1 Tax=Prorocentrum cordatum TaxID=2364126 RepID=A0ABN9QQ44_9DINO|nr:unnamed protein product [Polarella glacialis]